MFRAIVSPPSSGALDCVYSLWYNAPTHQQVASSVLYTTSCKHSLVPLRMGRKYRPKRVELIVIINKMTIVASSLLLVLLHSNTTGKYT